MNSDTTARLWKLQTSANELVLEGKREPDGLIEFLQIFVFGSVLPDIDWKRVYEVLGMSAEAVETLNTIMENPGFWLVPVVKGVTCNAVVAALRASQSRVWTYVDGDDLDKYVPTNDRDPNCGGSYVIGFRRTVEADEENANKSANALKAENHKGATLLERLLLELGYFLTTGQHMDVKNVTLCSGSRYSGGDVPSVDVSADGGGVYVGWCRPGSAYGRLRSRSVVSSAIPPA